MSTPCAILEKSSNYRFVCNNTNSYINITIYFATQYHNFSLLTE